MPPVEITDAGPSGIIFPPEIVMQSNVCEPAPNYSKVLFDSS